MKIKTSKWNYRKQAKDKAKKSIKLAGNGERIGSDKKAKKM